MFGYSIVKNDFTTFLKIPVAPLITMIGKMPNQKFMIYGEGRKEEPEHEELTAENTPAPWGAHSFDPDDEEDPSGANLDRYEGYGDVDDAVMARMRAKFAQYEREDQEAGAVRSFIYKEGERRHVGPSLFNTDNLQGTRPSQKKDPYRGYHTAGACSGFGFKKGDAYYVNEGLRCGCREKESRASILIYMLLCGCDPDSHGFSPYGNTRKIAKFLGVTVRTVRNSLWKLAEDGYIEIGGIGRDGYFTFRITDYEKIGLTYMEGGRGYLNLELEKLQKLASMRDVNAMRMAVRIAITVDNPRAHVDGTVVNKDRLRSALPNYVTREKFQEALKKLREACPFLEIKDAKERDFFSVNLPKGQDAKVRKAQSDMENLNHLKEYVPQLSDWYKKEYDEAEEFHHRFGKYPVQFNALEYEKEELDRELIFKAGMEDLVQYASMATQYGIGIVKQGLKYLACEVSVFRNWIESKPAYLRQMIRRHPNGIFNNHGVC